MEMSLKNLNRMAKELDQMTRSVTSDEADLLEVVLRKLKEKKFVTSAEGEAVKKMYDRYLSPRDEESQVTLPEESEEDDFEE